MADVSRLHAQALADLLGPLPHKVYVSVVTDQDADLTYPYVVLWPPPSRPASANLSATVQQHTTSAQLTAVGRDPNEVLAAVDRATALLVDKRPNLAGRNWGLVSLLAASGPPAVDRLVPTLPDGQSTFTAWAIFSLTSGPAPA